MVEKLKIKKKLLKDLIFVVNDNLTEAISKVEAIIKAEKCRVDRIEEMLVSNKEELIHEFLMDEEFDNSLISEKIKEEA